MERVPDRPFQLDDEQFAKNLRSARRGAAPGPSGMTTEHLFPLLESTNDTQPFCQLGNLLAQGEVPPEALSIIRKGRMTALQKPSGGVRGIVVGDTFRRLVARTIAQQVSQAVEVATAPFQYALRTRAGCECVSHVFQTLTDLDEQATILSVDGVGAFDLISRNAMMQGLMHMEGGEQVLLFVRLFYSTPSSFLWEDSMGTVHHIPQGEGGEQGDPLMPLLYALGQHSALVAVSERLRDDEILFAFLDDLHVKTSPERAVEAHRILSEELWWHVKIRLNQGKTCIWNQVGQMPVGCERLEAAARAENPEARVWRGDLPT